MDRREPEGIFDKLVELGYPPDLVTLETGDYQFYMYNEDTLTEIIIERATWGNLLDKIKTGELATQLRRAVMECPKTVDGRHVVPFTASYNLNEHPPITLGSNCPLCGKSLESQTLTILMIEGRIGLNYETGKIKLLGNFKPIHTGFRYSSVRGFLLAVQLAGVVVVYTNSKEDSAGEIVSLYKYFGSEDHESLTKNYRPKVISLQPPNVGEEILMSIPGIGIENARGLLGAFGSISGVAQAEEKEIMRVEKIGKVKARLVKDALNESYA